MLTSSVCKFKVWLSNHCTPRTGVDSSQGLDDHLNTSHASWLFFILYNLAQIRRLEFRNDFGCWLSVDQLEATDPAPWQLKRHTNRTLSGCGSRPLAAVPDLPQVINADRAQPLSLRLSSPNAIDDGEGKLKESKAEAE